MRPVRRRLRILVAATLLLLGLAGSWYSGFQGPTAYFDESNTWIMVVLILGVTAAIPAANGALRRLRSGLPWWPSVSRHPRLASPARSV